jgi:hypothetical protein
MGIETEQRVKRLEERLAALEAALRALTAVEGKSCAPPPAAKPAKAGRGKTNRGKAGVRGGKGRS